MIKEMLVDYWRDGGKAASVLRLSQSTNLIVSTLRKALKPLMAAWCSCSRAPLSMAGAAVGDALRQNGFRVRAVWPVRTESEGRLRTRISRALSCSFWLSCDVDNHTKTADVWAAVRAFQSRLPKARDQWGSWRLPTLISHGICWPKACGNLARFLARFAPKSTSSESKRWFNSTRLAHVLILPLGTGDRQHPDQPPAAMAITVQISVNRRTLHLLAFNQPHRPGDLKHRLTILQHPVCRLKQMPPIRISVRWNHILLRGGQTSTRYFCFLHSVFSVLIGCIMTAALTRDLKSFEPRAYGQADSAAAALRRYHAAAGKLGDGPTRPLHGLYRWMFVPITLWPFNVQDVLEDGLTALEQGRRLIARHRLLIDMLPEPPDETICAAVASHEHHVQQGAYENQVETQAKYSQNELAIKADPELRRQWARLKAAFKVQAYANHKGVIRRSMCTERNLRPWFSVNLRRPAEVFQAAFDAFCLRWNLYGMLRDEPLPLKLAVNLTPYGTLIHIPAYWSFDPKRGSSAGTPSPASTASASRPSRPPWRGLADRMQAAEKLASLTKRGRRQGLKGDKKHEFLCAGLGWTPGTSPKRLRLLRAEFKNASPTRSGIGRAPHYPAVNHPTT